MPVGRRRDLVAQRVEQLADRPLEQLERDVAGEAVGDDHIGGARAAGRGPRRCRRSSGGRPHAAAGAHRSSAGSPCSSSSPIESNRTSGSVTPSISSLKMAPICANCSRCSGRASAFAPASRSTEGPQRAGSGPRSQAAARRRGGAGGGGRPRASRRCCPRRPRRPPHARRRPYGRDEARVRLGAHRLGGLLRHVDPVGCDDELQAVRVETGRPVERDVDPVCGCVECAEDHLARRPVTTQCVDRDARNHATGLEAERLDLAALVRAAGRADAMRPLGRAALRARVDARRLELVLRATLVAAGFGGFSLGDSH